MHNRPRMLSPKLELSRKAEMKANSNSALLAFLHSLVTTFPTLCTSPPSYSPTTISMTTVSSQCNGPATYIVANMIAAHQHTSSNIPCNSCTTTLPTPLVTSKTTLGSTIIKMTTINPKLVSSACIELVSSSARVTPAKFQKGVGCS